MNDVSTQPIPPNQRTLIVDILRGWALLGVVLMNYFDFFVIDKDFEVFKPDTLTSTLMYFMKTVFAAKSWTMLSLLFGYGFAVLMNNVSNKGHNPYAFFAGRMFWLLVLALINSALFFGDILKDYAILGLLLLLFYRSSPKTSFIASLILLFSIPVLHAYINSLNTAKTNPLSPLFYLYKSSNLTDVLTFGLKGTYVGQIISKPYLYTVHVVMFCCFLWGFTLYRINFFNNLKLKTKQVKKAFWFSLGITLLLTAFLLIDKNLKWTSKKYYNVQYWLILSSMIFIVSVICWLYIADKSKRFFAALAVMGKMTLTNYMMQNLIGMLLFSGFGLGIWTSKPIWFYLILAIGIYTIQVYFSRWWLTRYNYGPVEWIWRQLSYQKRLPLKKQK
ncbi:DUF418 domain-containing protein [Pedobacter punctiformis]|uniref:DUF418 domain-containing protein n=1 Tax=Pedobacter punctiformis TaxID=3004097 RepID=A0ABT4L8X5_9SPHI|nr:DUF418 domain-containing protein [Pedobacter sp. HCMS5-2]MCZ4244380.1 DUF418 domain-containing protein [Pedobacter sp. HCMS5-2]